MVTLSPSTASTRALRDILHRRGLHAPCRRSTERAGCRWNLAPTRRSRPWGRRGRASARLPEKLRRSYFVNISEVIDCCIASSTSRCDRPDVGQIHRLAVSAFAERIFAQIDVDAPGQRERDHQRRRHQIVRAHFGVDASFKVAIAREHRGDDQFFFVDRLRNFRRAAGPSCRCRSCIRNRRYEISTFRDTAAVRPSPDNRGRLSIPGASEVFTHGGTVRPFSTAFLASKSGADQHRRIRSVGARSNRSNHNAAMLQRIFALMQEHARERSDLRRRSQRDFRPPAPSARLLRRRACSGRCGSLRRRLRLDQRRQRLLERLSRLRKHHAILRTLRPGKTRLNRREIEREQFRIFRLRSLLVMKQSLLAAVSLDQSNLLLRCAR